MNNMNDKKFDLVMPAAKKLILENDIDANIMEGLNIKYVGYVLAVLLIETPPSKYGKVGFDLPI